MFVLTDTGVSSRHLILCHSSPHMLPYVSTNVLSFDSVQALRRVSAVA